MNARVPLVGVMEFASTSSSEGTTCGSEAERAARKKRLMLNASRIIANSGGPETSAATSIATATTGISRIRFETTSTWRRLHRSRNTPTNGPSTLNGSSTAASAAAIEAASACRSGENRTYDASATWKMPSDA